MRKTNWFIMTLCVMFLAVSCNKEEIGDTLNENRIIPADYLLPELKVSNYDLNASPSPIDGLYVIAQRENLVVGRRFINFYLDDHEIAELFGDREEYEKQWEIRREYEKSYLYEPLPQNQLSKWGSQFFCYSAFAKGGMRITSDESLFGEEPGEDISRYFRVTNGPIVLETRAYAVAFGYDDYGTPPDRAEDGYFRKGAALLESPYVLTLREKPKYYPEKATLTVSIPLEADYIDETFWVRREEPQASMISKDITLTGSFTLTSDLLESFEASL